MKKFENTKKITYLHMLRVRKLGVLNLLHIVGRFAVLTLFYLSCSFMVIRVRCMNFICS